jgi:hypothetical protein
MSVLNMDKDKGSIFMAVSYLTCVLYVHFHVLGRMMFLDFVLLLMFLKKMQRFGNWISFRPQVKCWGHLLCWVP